MGGRVQYRVEDGSDRIQTEELDIIQATMKCTCRMYTRIGFLCRHMYAALKHAGIDQVPSQYINTHWTRNASIKTVAIVENARDEQGAHEEAKVGKTFLSLYKPQVQQTNFVQGFYNPGGPSTTRIHCPKVAKNKGSSKRLKSAKEITIEKKAKGERTCATCGKSDGHDSRFQSSDLSSILSSFFVLQRRRLRGSEAETRGRGSVADSRRSGEDAVTTSDEDVATTSGENAATTSGENAATTSGENAATTSGEGTTRAIPIASIQFGSEKDKSE
nr:protein FAR1-RELATED SEQUENCE 5-like [Ipomoea batatas]